ncbi:MAG: YihY/virulence factor BrkB family protein [Legionella sp.]|nr:YihY/virulence factor BrkB family protein [Legionella sp.]
MKLGLFLKHLATSWSTDKISTLSAALAYYTLFSLAPIVLISIDLAGFFFSKDLARSEVLNQITALVNTDISSQITSMLDRIDRPNTGILTQVIGWVLVIIGSSAVFSEMQSGLNQIWGVINPQKGFLTFLKQRLISFLMVLGVAILLLLSLVLSITITAMSIYVNHYLNIGPMEILYVHCISFFIAFLLFSMIFKILPDVKIPWPDIWMGALITTSLFQVGKFLLGIYLSRVQIASAFGAAGSLIIFMVWVYFSAQIFFIGALITKVIAIEKNEVITPKRKALKVDAVPHQQSSFKNK